ncbi:MAG: nickel-dependent hydrogenase large subunit, partial [Clostridia bacterium]|nr:nickel-dependent hydrogenase large subunit [Clostridia bacterium]
RPHQGETAPLPDREGGYSWIKSPRYGGEVREVGPLAHVLANYAVGDAATVKLVDWALATLKAPMEALYSVMGRHLARALATKLIADQVEGWLLALDPQSPVYQEYQIPEEGWGMGLTEAARGALGHWIRIQGGKIANYQCVVPTTWNASPRDRLGQPGPIEQALIGAPVEDPDNPWEVVRIIRSFDPCIACAVHLLTPKGGERARYRIL